MRLSFRIRKQKVDISNRSKMRTNNSEHVAKRICHYYENVCGRVRKKVYDHFKSEKIYRGTICRILDTYEERGSAENKNKNGHPARVMTPKVIRRVQKEFKKDPGVSERNLGNKLKICQSTLHNIKANKLGIKSYKAIAAPKYNQGQKTRAKTNCTMIAEKRLAQNTPVILVMDYEKYGPIDPNEVPGIKYYSCTNKKTVQDSFKYKPISNIPHGDKRFNMQLR